MMPLLFLSSAWKVHQIPVWLLFARKKDVFWLLWTPILPTSLRTQPAQFPGLIVLRLQQQDKPHILAVIRRLIPLLSSEPLEHLLWVVEETRIRVRS